jgi:hypothetical protein
LFLLSAVGAAGFRIRPDLQSQNRSTIRSINSLVECPAR